MDELFGNTSLTMNDKREVDNFMAQLSTRDKKVFNNLVSLSVINYAENHPGEALTEIEMCWAAYKRWHKLNEKHKTRFLDDQILERLKAGEAILKSMPIKGPMLLPDEKPSCSVQTSRAKLSKRRSSTGSSNPKKKVKKDPNAPKMPANGYALFYQDFYKNYVNEHPDLEAISGQDRAKYVAKAGGETWKAMSDQQKALWLGMATKLKREYQAELDEYKKKKLLELQENEEALEYKLALIENSCESDIK